MVLRATVHRWMRVHEKDRRSHCEKLGKATLWALYFMVTVGAWAGFKLVEPVVLPVVKNFEVASAVAEGDNLWIYGDFDKVRSCEFVEVVGYSGDKYVTVVFDEHPDAVPKTRLVGHQTFGPWLLVPRVSKLQLYARHNCMTGEVVTELFDGVVAK